jgi:hypothetical protein
MARQADGQAGRQADGHVGYVGYANPIGAQADGHRAM